MPDIQPQPGSQNPRSAQAGTKPPHMERRTARAGLLLLLVCAAALFFYGCSQARPEGNPAVGQADISLPTNTPPVLPTLVPSETPKPFATRTASPTPNWT